MSRSKITIATNQKYTCIQCGRCCRRWHVALSEQDIARLAELKWKDKTDIPDDPVTKIHGHPFIAHKPNGDCVFLDPETNLCRLHAQHGPSAKPLGCRVYPLNIASTFWGELSVTARMDCPAAQQNTGPPLREKRVQIERYAKQLGIKGGYSDELGGLSPVTVDLLCRALRERFLERPGLDAGHRNWAMLLAVERLRQLGVNFLNDTPTMEEVLPSFTERVVEKALESPGRRLSPFSRGVFREWLGAYLRRDEEVIGKLFFARMRRTLELALLLGGYGSFGKLGAEHPDIPVRDVPMFPMPEPEGSGLEQAISGREPPSGSSSAQNTETSSDGSAEDCWECYHRMLSSRLQTLQFFGVTYYGAMFFDGLRALVQTYPLVLAAARCHAASRHVGQIGAEDVQYAVGAVDHSFGRSRLLQMHLWRALEEFFSGSRYGRLLKTLGWH